MPFFQSGKRVTTYYIQRQDVNPAGRATGWITVDNTDDPADARQRAQQLRSHNPDMKVRVAKRETVRGGYTSL